MVARYTRRRRSRNRPLRTPAVPRPRPAAPPMMATCSTGGIWTSSRRCRRTRGRRMPTSPEALGLFVTALIAATPLDPQQPDDLPERVAEFPEVEDCLSVAGEASYILKVRTKTTGDLEDLIRRLREKAGVATRTTIALSIPFEGRPLPT